MRRSLTPGGWPGSPIKARATDAMFAFLGSAQRRGGFPANLLALVLLFPVTALAQSTTQIAKRAGRAVVAIEHSTGRSMRAGNPLDGQARTAGFLISAQGHIVTGLRFVEGRRRINVRLAGGIRARAELVGTDPLNQIALIKLQSPKQVAERFGGSLPTLRWGTSHTLLRGQAVFTLGNAFDSLILDGTPSFSQGVVTTIERVREGSYRGVAIETDAAVNPGSFGGPLVDRKGNVVGVVCTTFSNHRWLGQAIPGDQVRLSVEAMLANRRPAQGLLGVRLKSTGGEASARGLEVLEVQPGSSASKAGLQPGDLLQALDGIRLYDAQDVARELKHLAPGSPITLRVINGDTTRVVQAVLGRGAPLALAARPRIQDRPTPTRPTARRSETLRAKPALGLRLQEREGGRLGLKVIELSSGGKAAKAGVQVGDIIMAVDRQRLASLDDLRGALTKALRRPTMRLVVLRERRLLTLSIPLDLAAAPARPTPRSRPTPTPTPRSRPSQSSGRGYLGVFLDPAAPGPGARIDGAEDGSPAQRAGLRKGDIVVAAAGREIPDTNAFIRVLKAQRAGARLELTVRRRGWNRKLTVTLAGAPGETAPTPTPTPAPTRASGWLGVALVTERGRVVVSEVAPGSPCAKVGLKTGDKILSVDGRRVLSVEDVGTALRNKTVGQPVRFHVDRGGWTKFLDITLAKRP